MFSRLAGGLAEKINPGIVRSSADELQAAEIQNNILPEKKQSVPEKSAGINTPTALPGISAKDKFSEYILFLKAHRLQYPLILIAGMVSLYAVYRPAFVVLSFIFAGIASRLYQRYLRGLSLGIETIIFGAAITGQLYGPWPAALIGLIALPISVIYTEEDFKWMPVAMGGMVLVGILAAYLPPMSMLALGMILTLVYDITTCAVYMYVFHARFFTTAIFIGTHLLFNYFLFSHFGESVLSLLA